MRKCLRQISQSRVAFVSLQKWFWIQTYVCNCLPYLWLLDTLVECNPNKRGQGMMSVLPNQRPSRAFPTQGRCPVPPHPLPSHQPPTLHPPLHTHTHSLSLTSTYNATQEYSFFLVNEENIPNLKLFTNRVLLELSRIAFHITVLTKVDRTDFAPVERLDLPYWIMIYAICVSVDVSKYLDIPTSELYNNDGASSILTWVRADTASAACPAHPGSLAMTSITFAAVIGGADEPCSVNTAYDPEASLTMSPRIQLDFCIFETVAPTPNYWDDRGPVNDENCTVLASLLASAITSFFVSDFRQLSCRYFLECLPFFLHCSFCICYFHSLRHWDKFVHEIVVIPWFHSFSCNMIFMILVRRSFHALPRRFIGLNNASVFSLAIFLNATGFPVLHTLNFARHCGWHRNFRLSTRILHNLWILHHQDQCSKYHAIFWHCRASASRLPTFAFSLRFDASDIPFQISDRLLSCQSHPGPCISIRWFFI